MFRLSNRRSIISNSSKSRRRLLVKGTPLFVPEALETRRLLSGNCYQVAFTVCPDGVVAGDNFCVQASVEDQDGNVVTSDTSSITISQASGPGTLCGTTTVPAVNGVASLAVPSDGLKPVLQSPAHQAWDARQFSWFSTS